MVKGMDGESGGIVIVSVSKLEADIKKDISYIVYITLIRKQSEERFRLGVGI